MESSLKWKWLGSTKMSVYEKEKVWERRSRFGICTRGGEYVQ